MNDDWIKERKTGFQLQQKKTFTRWINSKLAERDLQMDEDGFDIVLADGLHFPTLVEVLSGETCAPKRPPKMKIQKIECINKALNIMAKNDIKLIGIGPEDIFDGKTDLILGTIWGLVAKYQNASKDLLIRWINEAQNVKQVKNLTTDLQDGAVFLALLNRITAQRNQDLVDADFQDKPVDIMDSVFGFAEENFEIPLLLDPADVAGKPEEKSIMTYLSYFRVLDNPDFVAELYPVAYECFAEGSGFESAKINKPNVFKVILCDEEGSRSKKACGDVYGSIAPLFPGGTAVEVEITPSKEGFYECSYTVDQPGEYLLTIKFDDEDLGNTPASVIAS